MSNDVLSTTANKLDELKSDAREAVLLMQGPQLTRVIRFIEALNAYEFARCASLDDEVQLRRAQGASQAFQAVHDLLVHTPVQYRRTTSRHEV